MTGLGALLLPIVLSAVVVFLMSSIIHMATPWHRGDYPRVPNEDKLMDAVRPLNIPPGDYMVPRSSSMEEMKSPEFTEKLKRGPVMVMTVFPAGGFNMGKNLLYWFLYCVVVGIFSAYVVGLVLPPGSAYMTVFRLIGATAFMGYSLALWQMTVWYKRALGTTFRATVDGLIYALLTAGVFGWLWPN